MNRVLFINFQPFFLWNYISHRNMNVFVCPVSIQLLVQFPFNRHLNPSLCVAFETQFLIHDLNITNAEIRHEAPFGFQFAATRVQVRGRFIQLPSGTLENIAFWRPTSEEPCRRSLRTPFSSLLLFFFLSKATQKVKRKEEQ